MNCVRQKKVRDMWLMPFTTFCRGKPAKGSQSFTTSRTTSTQWKENENAWKATEKNHFCETTVLSNKERGYLCGGNLYSFLA